MSADNTFFSFCLLFLFSKEKVSRVRTLAHRKHLHPKTFNNVDLIKTFLKQISSKCMKFSPKSQEANNISDIIKGRTVYIV